MNIIGILRRRDGEIKERFHVKRIGLFGSFARGEEKDSSDADITVEFDQPTIDSPLTPFSISPTSFTTIRRRSSRLPELSIR